MSEMQESQDSGTAKVVSKVGRVEELWFALGASVVEVVMVAGAGEW